MSKKRYVFTLTGVNISKIDEKYGIAIGEEEQAIPENTTKIDDLDIVKRTPDIISFLDESKRLRKCTVSMIDFGSGKEISQNKNYKCFWDKDCIPDNVKPIGCPTKYVPSKAIKSYHSEISKERYTIGENITEKKSRELKEKGDEKFTVERKGYYLTDGIFCSFNCCMAYIQEPENKRNPLYRHSEALLLQMYSSLHPDDQCPEILPAPHWRKLEAFGGELSTEKFRESFNKVSYVDHGVICFSLGRLYEDRIKF